MTKKIHKHFLALKHISLWDSISIRAENQNNRLASHCPGEAGWQVRNFDHFGFVTFPEDRKSQVSCRIMFTLSLGFSEPLVKSEPQLPEELIRDKLHWSKSVNSASVMLL